MTKRNLGLSSLLFSVFFVVGLNLSAQNDDKPAMDKLGDKPLIERISVSPSIGWLHGLDDFETDGFFSSFFKGDENELGYGININYQLTNVFRISGGVLFGELEGRLGSVDPRTAINTNDNTDFGLGGIRYQTDLFEFYLPRISANITRAIFKNRSDFFNKLSIGLFVSQGLVSYDSRITPASAGNDFISGRGDDFLFFSRDRGRTRRTTESVTSGGISFTYQINNIFDVSLESSVRSVYNDNLEAWEAGSSDDRYRYTALALTYNIGKKREPKKEKPADKLMADKEMLDKKEMADKMEDKQLEGVPMKQGEMMEEKKDSMADDMKEGKDSMADDNMGEKKESMTDDNMGEKKESMADDNTGEKKEVMKDEVSQKGEKGKTDSGIGNYESGYYVVVAAFRGKTSTGLMMTQLKNRGENPVVIRNLKDTWNLITIARYDDKPTALTEMRKARGRGFKEAWVHILPAK